MKPPNLTENSQSTGVLVSYRGFTFLDVGDLTWDKETDLACPVNKLGRVSLLLATHHGFFNDQSGAPALLWAIQPQVVIANNGPRKGMAANAYERIQKITGLEGLWQSHLALEWRMTTRRIFTTYFARGYKVIEFFLDRPNRRGRYLLASPPL